MTKEEEKSLNDSIKNLYSELKESSKKASTSSYRMNDGNIDVNTTYRNPLDILKSIELAEKIRLTIKK